MAKFNKSQSFTLSTNEIARLEALSVNSLKTPNEFIHQVINMGLTSMEFRKRYNARKTEERQIGRQFANVFNSGKLSNATMREIGIATGMIVDNGGEEVNEQE